MVVTECYQYAQDVHKSKYIKKQQNYTKRGIKIRFHIWIRCPVNVLLAGNTNERNLQIALRATVKVLIKHRQ